MTTSDITALVRTLPVAASIGDETYWSNAVPVILKQVLDEIASSYDFNFVMSEYSSVQTVADQADYNIYGDNYGLRDIISIRLGSDKDVLAKLRPLDADNLLSGGNTLGGVKGWYSFKTTNNGYPVVTLFDTPSSGGDTLYIRYRMKNIPIQAFPDSFGWVIARGVLAWVASGQVVQGQNGPTSFSLQQDAEFRFRQALARMIQRYRSGGADIDMVGVDPHITLTNKRRANLNRVG